MNGEDGSDTENDTDTDSDAENNGSDGSVSVPTDSVDQLLHTWKRPRNTFLLGILLGSLLVGTLVVSPPAALEPTPPEQIGEAVVDHYQQRAPAGITYELVDIRSHNSGLYQLTIQVQSGEQSTEETVWVTENGKWVFERQPSQVQPQITG